MQTAPNQRLLEWVRKFRVDLTPEGTITRLELYHSVEGGLGERLATFEMADRDEDEDPDDLAQEIWDESEEDAATRPTGAVERYVVQAFRGDTREPDEQKAFTTVGKLVTGLIGNNSEPPTARGEMMGEMRRTNDLHALVVRMCEATAGSAAVQLQREREENQRLRETAFEYEKLRQQLLDRSMEREIARDAAKSDAQQMQMVFGTLFQLAPIVLQRLLAPPPPAGATMPLSSAPLSPAPSSSAPAPSPGVPAPVLDRDRQVASLLESVSPSQLQGLLSTFSQEQTEQFLKIYTHFREHPPEPAPSSAPNPNPVGDRHVAN